MLSLRGGLGCLALTILSCAHAPLPAAALSAEEGTIAFVDVNVVPLDRERILGRQTVVVRAGSIVAIGPSAEVRLPARARVVDGRGKYLMPGLADMHAHLVRKEDMLLYVARGVTTVRNPCISPGAIRSRGGRSSALPSSPPGRSWTARTRVTMAA